MAPPEAGSGRQRFALARPYRPAPQSFALDPAVAHALAEALRNLHTGSSRVKPCATAA